MPLICIRPLVRGNNEVQVAKDEGHGQLGKAASIWSFSFVRLRQCPYRMRPYGALQLTSREFDGRCFPISVLKKTPRARNSNPRQLETTPVTGPVQCSREYSSVQTR